MKKTYIKPDMYVVEISPVQMIASSVTPEAVKIVSSDPYDDGGFELNSRSDGVSADIWDEEYDDLY